MSEPSEKLDGSSASPLLPRYEVDPEDAIAIVAPERRQSTFTRFFSQRLQGFAAALVLFLALPFARSSGPSQLPCPLRALRVDR